MEKYRKLAGAPACIGGSEMKRECHNPGYRSALLSIGVLLGCSAAFANSPPKAAPAAAAKPAAAPHAAAAGGFGHPNVAGGPRAGFDRGAGFDHGGAGADHRGGFDHGRGGFGHDHYAFHGRDVHHFDRFERDRWERGRWNQSCFDGRCGWWWLAGGQWYFYDQPVYPYPLVVAEITYADPQAEPPPEPGPPPPPPQAELKPPPSFRYYCDNPPGFYPQVAQCNGNFRSVAGP